MRANGYRTRQRDKILELLKNSKGRQMTTEEICEELKATGSKVGITTVYRYLDKLYTEGCLQRYTDGKESARYSYREKECLEHFHLKCTSCGGIFCADCDFLSGLCRHISGDHGFTVDISKTVFYGVCEKCKPIKEM